MTGHNHYSDCLCGWCVGGYRGAPPPKPRKPSAPSFTMRSITIPNAVCPVCGAIVFFYQNSFGSRVFFDELGPPWPKHPCTDNTTYRSPSTPNLQRLGYETAEVRASWTKADWIALRLEKQLTEDEWVLLRCAEVESGQLVRILVEDWIEAVVGLPVFMKPWTTQGTTRLSFINEDFSESEAQGYKYAEWFLRSPSELIDL